MYDDLGSDERGISEILGTVLLISMVLLGSATVIIFGASAISDATQRTTTEAATDYLETVDSRLATLSASSDDPDVVFDPQDAAAKDYHVDRSGYLNVTINGNADCSFQQPLSSIRYEDSNGNVVGYEAGGVWRAGVNGSAMLTPPDVSFTKGMVDVNLVNVTGTFDQSRNTVSLNVSETRNRTTEFQSALLRHDCARPDTVNVTVDSKFAPAWRDYLVSESGVPSVNSSAPGSRPAWVELNNTYLHDSANDATNNVVNLTEYRHPGTPDYMAPTDSPTQSSPGVTLDDGKPPSIEVDKRAGNRYMTYVGPVANDSLDIGKQISVDGTNVTGPPLDVTMVLDESGSMGWGDLTPSCADPDGDGDVDDDKMAAAQCAAKKFVGFMNESRDRVGIVSYERYAHYRTTDEYFSRNFDVVNETIEDLEDGGGTRIDLGLDYSNTIFDLKGNDTNQKVTVLLTDGINNGCDADDDLYHCENNKNTREAAWEAKNDSVTIYTIGFGSGADEDLLRDIAENKSDGEYYQANNASALADAFKNISERIQPKDAVANVPITTQVTNTTSNKHFKPEIPGDVNHIANNSAGYLNVNDPTAPAMFSHSFSIGDGDPFQLNVTEYGCKDNHYNTTGRTVTVGGQTRSVVRCTELTNQNESFDGEVYVDGDYASILDRTTYTDWQTNLTRAINSDQYPSTNITSSGYLDTSSNQALVVYDLPPGGSGTRNTLALIVRTGLAETDAHGTGIVTVRVAEAEIT